MSIFNDVIFYGLPYGDGCCIRYPVVVASTANVTLSSVISGSTLNGITLNTGDRILIKDQTTATENGIYNVQVSNPPVRSDDFKSGLHVSCVQVNVLKGTTAPTSVYLCISVPPNDIVGTNDITFLRIGGGNGSVVPVSLGGTGLTSVSSGNLLLGNGTETLTTKTSPSGTIVGTTDLQTLSSKSLEDSTTYIVDNLDNTKKVQFQVSGVTTGTTRTLTIPDISDTLVTNTATQTLTNKTLTAPAIDSITTLSTINTYSVPSSNIVGVSDTQTLTNKSLGDSTTYLVNSSDATKKVLFSIASISTGTTRTLTIPDINDTLVTLTASQTLTNKTLTTPILGAATATSINKVSITAPTTSATLTLADGSTLAISGANSVTFTSTGTTNITLPTSGTLTTLAGSETFTNKSLEDSTTYIVDNLDNTKKVQFQVSGVSTGTTRTLTIPDISDTLTTNTATQTLTNKSLTTPILSSGTSGSVLFLNSSIQITQDPTLFYYDVVNNSLGLGTNSPSTSSILDLTSSTKGLLPPRMSQSNINSITPVEGLTLYNTDSKTIDCYNGTTWINTYPSLRRTFCYNYTFTADTDEQRIIITMVGTSNMFFNSELRIDWCQSGKVGDTDRFSNGGYTKYKFGVLFDNTTLSAVYDNSCPVGTPLSLSYSTPLDVTPDEQQYITNRTGATYDCTPQLRLAYYDNQTQGNYTGIILYYVMKTTSTQAVKPIEFNCVMDIFGSSRNLLTVSGSYASG